MLTINKKDTLFLLGGHDLEMCTIRNILGQQGYRYSDHHLGWENALLSSYRKEMEAFWEQIPNGTIWGIELTNDIPLSDTRYHTIDHHNEGSDQPCALEQILSLLRLPMNRHYQLVAANDKAYIPGMQAIGATDDDIRSIRQTDRQAQGVTAEDERLAQKAITEELRKTNGLIIVKAYNSRFSPICDRLFPYQSLLIYTPHEWTYYGNQAKQIQEMFINEYKKGKLFYGGNANGYIGSKKGVYTETEINAIIKKIEYEFI